MPQVFVCELDWEHALAAELRRTLDGAAVTTGPGRAIAERDAPPALEPVVAFASQCLPDAAPCEAPSISAWADAACAAISARLDAVDFPWRLQVFPSLFPDGASGARRAEFVREKTIERLREVRRRLLRRMNSEPEGPWLPDEAFVQVLLTSSTTGFISVVDAERRRIWRRCLSRFVGGYVEPTVDKAAPSRAFAKLVEAERHLGRAISANETCVDLGASPGSWTYTALRRGATVTAIDRSSLRDDLMRDPRVTFVRGDAFAYLSDKPVDWLLSDVIAFPDRICELLENWLGRRRCRRFVVTIKFRGRDDDAALEDVKSVLRSSGYEFGLRRLTANKNEATAYGAAEG